MGAKPAIGHEEGMTAFAGNLLEAQTKAWIKINNGTTFALSCADMEALIKQTWDKTTQKGALLQSKDLTFYIGRLKKFARGARCSLPDKALFRPFELDYEWNLDAGPC